MKGFVNMKVYIIADTDDGTMVFKDKNKAYDYILPFMLADRSLQNEYIETISINIMDDPDYQPPTFKQYIRDNMDCYDLTDYDLEICELIE